MAFSDLQLARRLERAEGHAAAQYAVSRHQLCPESNAEWMECGGAYAIFDGVDSPVTQTFGLGVFEEWTPASLDTIEGFFLKHASPVQHEVSPFAGVAALDLLCRRNYRPIELSNVLYREVENPASRPSDEIAVRVIGPSESELWSRISAEGWSHEHPEFRSFLLELGKICSAREDTFCFLGEIAGEPGCAGVLCIHEGVALLGGSATIPELRRRGLQNALVQERMRYAFDHGCDLAMMVAEPGSNSQRNGERRGFSIAYTRTKWKLNS